MENIDQMVKNVVQELTDLDKVMRTESAAEEPDHERERIKRLVNRDHRVKNPSNCGCEPTYDNNSKPLDPWKHRSERMRCSTCMWYCSKVVRAGTEYIGRCRRHSPSMNGYPAVYPDDWCGDHKVDENKL